MLGFLWVAAITPGPNNMLLTTSGANFGFMRSLWLMIGIMLGMQSILLLVAFGVGGLILIYPSLHFILKVLGSAYLLWLAWKIANAVPPEARAVTGKPFTFLQAAAFQWVNPKAWMMGITAISTFATTDSILVGALIVGGMFTAVSLPIVSLWALVGVQLRRWLGTAHRLRVFNVTMAALLVASLWPMLR